ncbi:MAG: hypothetical protein ACOH1E_05755 [Brevundimonas sp.]
MRRAPILTSAFLAAAGVVLFAAAASAQTADAPAGEARGLRYLSWSSRGEVTRPTPAVATPAAPYRSLRRPNRVIPHGGLAEPAPASLPPGPPSTPGVHRTLTPANAWMHRPAPQPEPTLPTAGPAPVPAQPLRAIPDYLPDAGGRAQAVPAALIAAPASVRTDPSDPMAPRRDAPIFRMQQEAPPAAQMAVPVPAVMQPAAAAAQPRRVAEAVNTGERPPQQGGRYYSVHRQNGRQPDALEMPDPTYVDAIAVTMPETIASQDLAAPEQGPTLIRDNQGRLRPAAAASDGDHQ